MLSLYVAGFVAAMTTARLLKSSILKSSETPFILELPQYRMPTPTLARPAPGGSRAHLHATGRHHHLCRHAGALGAGASACHSHRRQARYAAPRTGRQPHRPPRPLHRAGHCAARLQLEDRHRPALERAGARSHGQHHGHALRRRSQHPGHATCKPLCTTT